MSDKSNISTNTINYYNASILHDIKVDKHTSEVREYFIVDCSETKEKFKIKKEAFITLAELSQSQKEFSLLLQNGWEGSEKMRAGAGLALKMTREADFYNCIFYEGELGKPFETNKIVRKSHLQLDKSHTEAIFIFLLKNEQVQKAKNEELKLQKTTLNLG